MNNIKFEENLFSMSEWSDVLSKFSAKMRVTTENKATSNIPEVRQKLTCWVCYAWLTIYIKSVIKIV